MEPSPSPLSDETRKAIEELAQEIAGANDLDPEIGAELRGHIEDKVAGYLSGEVRPSERDAMLLARAHFGDPAMVSVFLARVHGRPVGMPLFRQLATLGLLTLIIKHVVSVVVGFLNWRFVFVPAALQAIRDKTSLNDVPFQIVASVRSLIESLVLVAVLLFLRKYEKARGRPFIRLPVLAIIALPVSTLCFAAGSLLRDWLMPAIGVGSIESTHRATFMLDVVLSPFVRGLVFPGCMFFVWLWWIGLQRNRVQGFLAVAGAWLGAMCLGVVPSAVVDAAPKALDPMAMAISGWTHVHDGVGRVLDFHLQLLLMVSLVYGAWLFVGQRLGRRRGITAE